MRHAGSLGGQMAKRDASDWSDGLTEDFAIILLTDVAASMQRYASDLSEQAKREMVRTLFAAIEGFTWLYREHVIEAARSMARLTLEEEIALSEINYQVNEQGRIVEQPKYLSMLATFRLTTRIASRLSPELSVRFDTSDWDRLRSAVAVRNRVTHPKSRADLQISTQDLMAVQSAFHWLLSTAMGAMEETNAALRQHTADFHAVLAELRAGNPFVWAAYNAAKSEEDR